MKPTPIRPPHPRAPVWRRLATILLGVLALAPGAAVRAQTGTTAAAMPEGPRPVLDVVGVVGAPKLVHGGAESVVTPTTKVALGDVIETDENSRVAISFAPRPSTAADQRDLFLMGGRSRAELKAAPPAPAGLEEGAHWPPVSVVVDRGIYQAVAKGAEGTPVFTVRTGDRVVRLDHTVTIGTYEPETDSASHMVLTGEIVIEAGKRNVLLTQGMVRMVEDGRILGARRLRDEDREHAVALTHVEGVDVSMLDTAMLRLRSQEKTPKAWEYDPVNDRYWNPLHGHWHGGKPPPGVSPEGEGGAAEKGGLHAPVLSNKAPSATQPDKAAPKAAEGEAAPKAAEGRAGDAAAAAKEDLVYAVIHTSMGEIEVELNRTRAPKSVANFLSYAAEGFFEGTIFHRVIDGFMIQGGGFTADMQRRPTHPPVENEWKNELKNKRGTLAMARLGGQADSATSQFFINVKDNDFLDMPRDGAAYAVFGKVTHGMEVVDAISKVTTTQKNGMKDVPEKPVVIEKVEVLESQ